HALDAAGVLPPELLREHARHPPRVPPARWPARLRGAARGRGDALARLRHLLRLRALRERAGRGRQRGVPELREVRAEEAQARRTAPPARRTDERAPPRARAAS